MEVTAEEAPLVTAVSKHGLRFDKVAAELGVTEAEAAARWEAIAPVPEGRGNSRLLSTQSS